VEKIIIIFGDELAQLIPHYQPKPMPAITAENPGPPG